VSRDRTFPWPLATATVAAFVPYREFFTSQVPVSRDLAFYFYPLKAHMADAIRHGQVPWLDPYRWGGVPLLGAPGAAVFYPGNVLFIMLPLGVAMKVWILLHLALGVAGFAAFARRLGLASGWAAVAGLGFALGGASVSLAPFPSSFSAFALLPWFAAAVVGLTDAPAGRTVVKAALFAALLLLAGIPEFVLFGAAVAAVLAWRRGTDVGRSLGLLSAAAVLAGLLAAPQLVPSVSTMLGSTRGPGGGMNDATAGEKSLPRARLVEFLGDGLVADWTKVAAAPGVPGYPYLPSITPGRVVLLLALVGLIGGGRGRLSAVVLVVAGVGLALGPTSPVWQAAAGAIPFFRSLRYPEKDLVLTAFGAAWLAALGIGVIAKRARTRGAVIAVLLGAAVLVDRERTARLLAETDAGSCLTEPPAILRPSSQLRDSGESVPRPRLFHFDSWAPVPRFDLSDLLAANRAARASLDPGYASLFGTAYILEPDYDVSLPQEAAEWNRLMARSAPVSSGMTFRMVRAAGATAVLRSFQATDGRFVPALRPLRDPLSPYRFVARVVSDPDGLRLFKRFLDEEADPSAAWVVRPGAAGAVGASRGSVLSVRDRADGLFLEVDVNGPGAAYLMLWRLRAATKEATLDGRAVPVEDAAFGFSGLAVPPGRHRLRFRPPGGPVRWGLGAAAIGVVACAALWTRRPGAPGGFQTDGAT
jgi:hypothetical protein